MVRLQRAPAGTVVANIQYDRFVIKVDVMYSALFKVDARR